MHVSLFFFLNFISNFILSIKNRKIFKSGMNRNKNMTSTGDSDEDGNPHLGRLERVPKGAFGESRESKTYS